MQEGRVRCVPKDNRAYSSGRGLPGGTSRGSCDEMSDVAELVRSDLCCRILAARSGVGAGGGKVPAARSCCSEGLCGGERPCWQLPAGRSSGRFDQKWGRAILTR
jgi:hypothetical protein